MTGLEQCLVKLGVGGGGGGGGVHKLSRPGKCGENVIFSQGLGEQTMDD